MKKYTTHKGVEFLTSIGDQVTGNGDWCLLIGTLASTALGMKHPNEHISGFGEFIDEMIRNHGDYLFMGLVYLMIALVIWGLVRRRKTPPTHRVTAVPTLLLDVHPQTDSEMRSGSQEELDFQFKIERLDSSGKDRDSSLS